MPNLWLSEKRGMGAKVMVAILKYKQEALDETIQFSKKDDYQQAKSNEMLAKILEIVREQSKQSPQQTAHMAMKQIVRLFPE